MNIAIGDIHGSLEKLLALLEHESLIGHNQHWAADDTHLIFLGDYLDRGEDGIGVLETSMRLELEAAKANGKVTALLGNHDLILLEVDAFGDAHSPISVRENRSISFHQMWLENAGGKPSDLERLTQSHVNWLEQCPAMLKIGNTLLLHADSEFYLRYGQTVFEVNQNIRTILQNKNMEIMDLLEYHFCRRKEFIDVDIAQSFATHFGANKIVHGHTPIYKLCKLEPQAVTEPLKYANGMCVNLDHGLCYGGEGFVYAF